MHTSEIRDQKLRNTEVRKRLTEVIGKNGMSFKFVAERLGVTQSSFSQWKSGNTSIAIARSSEGILESSMTSDGLVKVLIKIVVT